MNPSAGDGAILEVRGVRKRLGAAQVLDGVSLRVDRGELLTLLGESGSGKTTLLRLCAGFLRPDEGEIWIGGERVDALPPYRRRVNTVFQHYALFPHMSVAENVAYGLRVTGVPRGEVASRAAQALTMVKMGDFAAAAPSRLSGGQQQRVALARALVNRPLLLLLDEPLSALDAGLRRQMQEELKALQREVGIAFVFVTHDQEEALALSDRIVLLRGGRIEQVGTPQEIYERPATAYTARFIGQTNLLRCQAEGGRLLLADGGLQLGPAPAGTPDGPVTISLRPERLRLAGQGAPAGADASVRFQARVIGRVYQGATVLLHLRGPGQADVPLLCRVPAQSMAMAMAMAAAVPADASEAATFEFALGDAVPVRESAA